MNGLNLPDDPLLGADPLGSARAGRRWPVAGDDGRGLKAARDFEAVLLHRLMEAMRRTVPDSGLLSGPTTRQMEGLFWFYLAQEVAEKGGIGLAGNLARKLELADGPAAPRPDTETRA